MGRERDALAVWNVLRPFLGYRRAMAGVLLLFAINDARNIHSADPGGWLPTALPEDIEAAAVDFDARDACHDQPATAARRAGRHVLITGLYALEANLGRIRANVSTAAIEYMRHTKALMRSRTVPFLTAVLFQRFHMVARCRPCVRAPATRTTPGPFHGACVNLATEAVLK